MRSVQTCRHHLVSIGMLMLCDVATSAYLPNYPLGLSAAADLLEITLPTSKSGVRAAYRKKASTTHPDVSAAADAATHFLRITTAYETLLQFSYTVPITMPPKPKPAEPSAPPRTSDYYADTRPHSEATDASRERSEVGFAARVASWREYWTASLQAEALATELRKASMQQSVLASELVRLREQLATLRQNEVPCGGGARSRLINHCSGRYAHCSSKHADVSCTVRTLEARVRMMREEATRLERSARQHVDVSA